MIEQEKQAQIDILTKLKREIMWVKFDVPFNDYQEVVRIKNIDKID